MYCTVQGLVHIYITHISTINILLISPTTCLLITVVHHVFSIIGRSDWGPDRLRNRNTSGRTVPSVSTDLV